MEVNFPLVPPVMGQLVMWGVAIGPLAFGAGAQLHDLPRGLGKVIPKFIGYGKVSPDEHMRAFFVSSSILAIQHEDVSMRLFVESLIDVVADLFYSLPNGSINNWAALRTRFEDKFKFVEDDQVLVAQLGSMKREVYDSMRIL